MLANLSLDEFIHCLSRGCLELASSHKLVNIAWSVAILVVEQLQNAFSNRIVCFRLEEQPLSRKRLPLSTSQYLTS